MILAENLNPKVRISVGAAGHKDAEKVVVVRQVAIQNNDVDVLLELLAHLHYMIELFHSVELFEAQSKELHAIVTALGGDALKRCDGARFDMDAHDQPPTTYGVCSSTSSAPGMTSPALSAA